MKALLCRVKCLLLTTHPGQLSRFQLPPNRDSSCSLHTELLQWQCATVMKRDSEHPLMIGYWTEPKTSFRRGAACRRCNYKLDLNKQTAAAWPPLHGCLVADARDVSLLLLHAFKRDHKRARTSMFYIERTTRTAPCYHARARPHMHCVLSNDKSRERINILHTRHTYRHI